MAHLASSRICRRIISKPAEALLRQASTSRKRRQRRNDLTIKGKAYIVGAFEHPTRHAPDKSDRTAPRRGRQGRASRTQASPRTTSTAISAPATRPAAWASMVDYMGLKVRHMDSTDTGGSLLSVHLGHAAAGDRGGQMQRSR